jgi:hypothetical protein
VHISGGRGGSESFGLFGHVVGATIENLNIEDVTLQAAGFVGAVAGQAWGNSVIRNVHTSGIVEGTSFTGGIVGYLALGSITDSTSEALIRGTRGSVGGIEFLGGIAGGISNTSSITNTTASGQVWGVPNTPGGRWIGGIVGGRNVGSGSVVHNNRALNPFVQAAYNHGRVTGRGTGMSLYGNTALATMTPNQGAAFPANEFAHDRRNGGDDGGGGNQPLPQEPTPNIQIDFINETLTGFTGGSYTINGVPVTVVGGTITILEEWMGTTLSIVRVGDSTTATDSDAQMLPVPARPAAPNVNATNETAPGALNGSITNLTINMEWRVANGTWANVTGVDAPDMTGLGAGTYNVRDRATSTSFASEIAVVYTFHGDGIWAQSNPAHGGWAFYTPTGDRIVSWVFWHDGHWRFLNPYMVVFQTIFINGRLHRFNSEGHWIGAQPGWTQLPSGHWVFYRPDGTRQIGPLFYPGTGGTYNFDSNGIWIP